MKANSRTLLALTVSALGALALSMTARAEHVLCDSPEYAGVPIKSLVKGGSSSLDQQHPGRLGSRA